MNQLKLTIALLLVLTACSLQVQPTPSLKELFGSPNNPLQNAKGKCSVSIFDHFLPKGYPKEIHTVTSEQGYIINMFRIGAKNSKISNKNGEKPVVFLQHGLSASADSWVLNKEEKALGLMMANRGFDVWLGNTRGNKYAYSHVSMSPETKEFWQFSWQEMGVYDVPAMINYILKKTGTEKLTYIGHSQGTTMAFTALTHPRTHEWANKVISHLVALAPVCYMTHFRQPTLSKVAKHRKLTINSMKALGIYQLGKNNCKVKKSVETYYNTMCKVSKKVCYNKYKFMGKYPEMNDPWRVGLWENSKPQGMPVRTLNHYAQLISQPKPGFFMFNYDDKALNMKHYGTATPPRLDLGLIRTRVTMYAGTGDLMSNPVDAQLIKEALVNSEKAELNVVERYGHTSFVLGLSNGELYSPLVEGLFEEAQGK